MRVLAFAYACEPDKGSEPGAGWGLARMIARELGECWVVTRANNREVIEAALPRIPEADRLRFIYLDLPRWARWWKRGQRGVRLYYLLWQAAAVRRGRALAREQSFDLVWHLTLANAWLGSLAPLVPGRFVYGPVGGGVRVPWRLARYLGFRGVLYEAAREVARFVARYLNPAARLAWARADVILAQNPETVRWLPRRHRAKACVFPNALVGADGLPEPAPRQQADGRVALFVGRLLPLKGGAIAIEAIARTPDWRLVVMGDGPDRERLERLARKRGVADRVEFRGWRPREDVWRAMREEASVLLFPSLHDEAGWVAAEALSQGLPVLCLDHGGPPGVCRQFAERVSLIVGQARPGDRAPVARLALSLLRACGLQLVYAVGVEPRLRPYGLLEILRGGAGFSPASDGERRSTSGLLRGAGGSDR
jgi:glycosyltransferase involved in cell wall biosynthesis